MKHFCKNTVVKMAVLTMAAFFLVLLVTLRLQQNDLNSRADALRGQIEDMQETIDALQADLDRPFDEEYVAEVAHEKLGLCFPQEVIYISGDGN